MTKSIRMRWAGHVTHMGRTAHRILVEKPEGKRPSGKPRHRLKYNIKIDIREEWWGGMDWIHLVQGRDQWRAHVNTALNLWAPENVGKLLRS
jgi:hypothetical protein